MDGSSGGNGVLPSEKGPKDVVIAYPGEITKVRATFDKSGLYVWHCHILEHEDNEMMRPFCVGEAGKDCSAELFDPEFLVKQSAEKEQKKQSKQKQKKADKEKQTDKKHQSEQKQKKETPHTSDDKKSQSDKQKPSKQHLSKEDHSDEYPDNDDNDDHVDRKEYLQRFAVDPEVKK
jgi:hydroxylamine reductase (hybrid-cluster protein)